MLCLAQQAPNILVIIGDDMRWDSFSVIGNEIIDTPNIDRIANEGFIANRFYAHYSICSPSRASILTGLQCHVTGVNNNKARVSIESYPTMGKVFKEAGYQTALIGKYHLKGLPRKQPGYDYWLSFSGSGQYLDPPVVENDSNYVYNGHLTQLLTEKSLEFIQNRNSERPFLLVLMHKTPKTPYSEYQSQFDTILSSTVIDLPRTYREDLSDKPEFLRVSRPTGVWEDDRARTQIRDYYRLVKGLDESVGHLMNALEEEGIMDNSMVIFSSDHGFHHFEHNIQGKRYAYEESIRVPFFVRYPSWFEPGTSTNMIGSLLDLLPTMMHAAQIGGREQLPGKSILDLLEGVESREQIVIQYQYDTLYSFPIPTYRALRYQQYKYVKYFNTISDDELYDLETDPYEEDNILFTDSSRRTHLAERLLDEMHETADLLPDIDVYFGPDHIEISNSGNHHFSIQEVEDRNNVMSNRADIEGATLRSGDLLQMRFELVDPETIIGDTITIADTAQMITLEIPVRFKSESVLMVNPVEQIMVRPNPSSQYITVEHESVRLSHFEIYAMTGQKLLSGDFNHGNRISLVDLPRGTYLLKLVSDKGVVTKKITKSW